MPDQVDEHYRAFGFEVFSFAVDPVPPFGDVNNVAFRGCFVTEISAPVAALGYFTGAAINDNFTSIARNIVIENGVAEQILCQSESGIAAGIYSGAYEFIPGNQPAETLNLFVRDCRISDVRGGDPNLSAGILVRSLKNPVLCGNSVSASANGIILSKLNELGDSKCGLIQENKIDNCTYTGFRDDATPTTSAFLSNTAFKNGRCHSDNYRIDWDGKAPVCRGRLNKYPICLRPYNLSLLLGVRKSSKFI